MTYAFVQDVPIDAAFYARMRDGLGPEPPDGLISHVAMALAEGGLRYVDVWETEEAWDRFVDDRLHPVIHALLADVFGDDLPPEPESTPIAVVDVWTGTGAWTGPARQT
jgi:hypothetical protein